MVFAHPGQPVHDTTHFPANSAAQLELLLVFSHLLFFFRIEGELTQSLFGRTFSLEQQGLGIAAEDFHDGESDESREPRNEGVAYIKSDRHGELCALSNISQVV
jgi:hypothetical protein